MRLAAGLLVAALIAKVPLLAQSPDGFRPLFDGRTLSGWVVQNESKNFTVADGILTVHGSGPATKCTGDLYSEGQYGDFTLRLELRMSDSDGGLFIRVPPPLKHDVGLQLQLRDMSKSVDIRNSPRLVPWMANLMRLGPGVPQGPTVFDSYAAMKAYRPSGEWQTIEVTVVGSHISAKINGVSVMSAENIAPAAGHLVLQCEQGDVDFRAISVRELRPGA